MPAPACQHGLRPSAEVDWTDNTSSVPRRWRQMCPVARPAWSVLACDRQHVDSTRKIGMSAPQGFCRSAYRRVDIDEFKRSVLARSGASASRKMVTSQGDYHGLRKGETFESSIFLPLNGDAQRRPPSLFDHERRSAALHPPWANGHYALDSGRDSDKASIASTYASIGRKAKGKENSSVERSDSRRKSKRNIKRVPSKTRSSNFLRPKFPYKNYISRVTTKGKNVFPPPPPPDDHSAEETDKEKEMHRQRAKASETVVSQVTFAMRPISHSASGVNNQQAQLEHSSPPVRFQADTIRKSQSHHVISPKTQQEPIKTQPLTRSAPLHDWRRLIDEDAPPPVDTPVDRGTTDNNDAPRRSPEESDLRSPSVAERALFWRRSRSTDAITASLVAASRSQSRQPSPRRRSFEEQQLDECFSPEDKSSTASPKNELSPPQKRTNGILKKSPSPEIDDVDVGSRKMSDSSADDFTPPQSDVNNHQTVEKFKEMRHEAELLLRYFRTHREILNYLGIGLSENLWLQVRSLSKAPMVELTELYESKPNESPNNSVFMFTGEQHGVVEKSSSSNGSGSVKKESIIMKKKKKLKSMISSKSPSPKKLSPTASIQPMPIRESPAMIRREDVICRDQAEMLRREQQAEMQRRDPQENNRREASEMLRREPAEAARREQVVEPVRRDPPKMLGRSLSAPFTPSSYKDTAVNHNNQYVASRQESVVSNDEEEEYDDYAAEEKRVFAERDIDQAVRESKEKYESHVVEEEEEEEDDSREEILQDFEDVSKQMADSRHTSVSNSLERNHQKPAPFLHHPKTIVEGEPLREHVEMKRVVFPSSIDRHIDEDTIENRNRLASNGRMDEFEYHKYNDFNEIERADDGRRYGSSSFVQDFQPEKNESRTGRFVKKSAAGIIARKQTTSVSSNINIISLDGSASPKKRVGVPENKKLSVQKMDVNKMGGESRIAAEIRNLREREDELRRSRSELGLPSLEDIVDTWRYGNGSQQTKPAMPPLRGARSYDHLHLALEESAAPVQGGTEPRVTKSGSVDHLHQAHIYDRSSANVDEGYFTYQSDQSMAQAQYGSERPAGTQRSRKVRIANDDRRERFVQEMAHAPPPPPQVPVQKEPRPVEEKIRSDVMAAMKREEEHRRERERAQQHHRFLESEEYATHKQLRRQQNFNMDAPTSVRL